MSSEGNYAGCIKSGKCQQSRLKPRPSANKNNTAIVVAMGRNKYDKSDKCDKNSNDVFENKYYCF